MKTIYNNRYGDDIIFEQISEVDVVMTGFNAEWLRCGYENVYDPAYESYMSDINKMVEPNFDLLIDDPSQNITRPCTFEEFKEFVHEYYPNRINPLRKYQNLIKSDENNICMVDPSGGPYLCKGYDIGLYFNDKKKRIIESIQIDNNKVYFKIKEHGSKNKI